MQRIVPILTALTLLVGCGEEGEPYDNDLSVTVGDEDFRWFSNDGGCQLRNVGQNLSCELRAGVSEDDHDFRLTLSFSQELTERIYTDTVQTADPDISFDLWSPGGGTPRHFVMDSSINADQVVELTRLAQRLAVGTFEGAVLDEETREVTALEGRFTMTLTE